MNVDLNLFRRAIELSIRPAWSSDDDADSWRPGGGEVYLQAIPALAGHHLTSTAIQHDLRAAVLGALRYHENLLSRFEVAQVQSFIKTADAVALGQELEALLRGHGDVASRARRFVAWATRDAASAASTKRAAAAGDRGKRRVNATVVSYLLAAASPRDHAFCKPSVYRTAVPELLGQDAVVSDPFDRLTHCTLLYQDLLQVLERDYDLRDGNLFDVSSILFCLQNDEDGKTGWDLARDGSPPRPSSSASPAPTPPDTSPETSELRDLLLARHNVILHGPPGTGKTREAHALASWWRQTHGEDTVRMLTFHPSYAYEDFLEGFRPARTGGGFQLQKGIFRELCELASTTHRASRCLLLIDEINRGDLAKILGELITLLESDKRGPAHTTLLPQSREPFFVPDNLFVLGTMNTADRSISLMDLAVRRRFVFRRCPPDPAVLDEAREHAREVGPVRLSRLLRGLNHRLAQQGIERDRAIGHAYLLVPAGPRALAALRARFRHEICPLLEEYCHADPASLRAVLGPLLDEQGEVSDEILGDDEAFLRALEALSTP